MRSQTKKTYRTRPCVIALTGGFGSGKSLALSIIRQEGIPVLQTDKVGHGLLRDSGIVKALVKKFGNDILTGRYRVDRKKLARQAFRSLRHQKEINKILHPLIRHCVKKWVAKQTKKDKSKVILVVEVPLLFETDYSQFFDRIICVSASKSLRHKRLLKMGWSREEIKKREKLQWPQNKKNQMADWVIFNTGSPRELRYTIQRWLRKTVLIKD